MSTLQSRTSLMDQQLHTFITRFLPDLTEEEYAVFSSFFKPWKAKKKSILISPGEVASYMYFIQSGCMRAFYIQDNGNEATRYINFEGNFATSLSSFITARPATDFLDCVEDCQGLRITKEDFFGLVDTYPRFEKIYRRAIEMGMVHNIWRIETLINMDAKTRYETLLKTNPVLIQRLSNRIVASYLGITQESLSRLKANISL